MTIETPPIIRARFTALEVTNFLSYKQARLELTDLIALVGPNASGKSNVVAAIKLLREIPIHGLPIALARRGGYDQLRHKSNGRPNDPSLRLEFELEDSRTSYYEIRFGAVPPRSYKVKSESAEIALNGQILRFTSDGMQVQFDQFETIIDRDGAEEGGEEPRQVRRKFPVAPGQSALSSAGTAGYICFQVLQQMQTVEINPSTVAELQEPSSTKEFEPDGSNSTSVFELLTPGAKAELIDELNAIVPGIVRIEIQRLSDRQTFKFFQSTQNGNREFFAKQMSDGTLRAFSILLAMKQPRRPGLLVIEEPEVAIHLGALRTLVDIIRQESDGAQIVLTTHSADIVDSVPIESLRVVSSEDGESHIGLVAKHTIQTVQKNLITPGELLRADSLDVETES
ncbi:hypothetical protein C5C31_11465 [Rathayibacter rathayi]|uniref:ATPase AAA-type core domain-containing protein n=1 Tax=Rathayibacter rathayi TaxID=33887 RepID=A0ABD6W7G4_RATRA|nr:AAA family ATPase [Rathayibacter rathayi]PPF11748.1 hypothetical protein C5C04_11720 [Rathayibacter rathayi]PPG67054.1 hypothetical protein C5C02_10420 [Rathayibacter rathayi]PPG75381.1 hypothetical protein C5C23_10580 [Rathayibacter rathayi]PPH20404.1 hypothetical protein C5C31_11465 [Rathayibacter rathayi]PPH65924.1 hypothetical protein C5C45_11045 [Rathayibacter rathayi]